MRQLDIVQDQLEYVGLLAAPAFRYFTNPAVLASGLYHAFQGYHSGTDDITFEHDATHPLRQACTVDLGTFGSYKLSLERVEWARPGAWPWELNSSVLAAGDTWLRSIPAGGALMHSHYFTYTAHALPVSETARDLLLGLGGPTLSGFGESNGTGLIFHSQIAPGSSFQLTIDHSHEVQNGVFIALVVIVERDQIDYLQVGHWLLGIIHQAARSLELEIVTGVG
jgi:hypothetical protein